MKAQDKIPRLLSISLDVTDFAAPKIVHTFVRQNARLYTINGYPHVHEFYQKRPLVNLFGVWAVFVPFQHMKASERTVPTH